MKNIVGNIEKQFENKTSIIIDPKKHQEVISITVLKPKRVKKKRWNGLS